MVSRDRPLSRRLFSAHLAACAAGCVLPWRVGEAKDEHSPGIRIGGLRLQTAQPLDRMKRFYGETLGFAVTGESGTTITFRTGAGRITFEHVPGIHACYHFAFNIPENQILKAHAWQRDRTGFILPPERLNDPGLPRAVVAFRHWNAHSVFFWDPAGNAVEYIARHDLDNAAPDELDFGVDQILHISEIGLVVDDVPGAAAAVKETLGVETYVSASRAFEPIGSQHGLLLMMQAGRRMAFDQGCRRAVYPTEVHLDRAAPERMSITGYPYTILASAAD